MTNKTEETEEGLAYAYMNFLLESKYVPVLLGAAILVLTFPILFILNYIDYWFSETTKCAMQTTGFVLVASIPVLIFIIIISIAEEKYEEKDITPVFDTIHAIETTIDQAKDEYQQYKKNK